METQLYQRMFELSRISDQQFLKNACVSMIVDLKQEGFESQEIYEFLCELVQEAGN